MDRTVSRALDGLEAGHASAAFVVTGDVLELHNFLERLEAFCERYGVRIAYQTVGARNELRIVRGRGP